MALNVLIVDDSLVVRKMIGKILNLAGVPLGEVFEAGNGREGLDVLEQNWVDLLIADLNMPVMNGEEMIEQIRSNPTWADLPVLIISTEGSESRIERLLEKNTVFIHKPFTPEKVRDTVTEMLGVPHE